ncbi:MAG: DUF3604 domain-containing protein [Verrucomicrobiales bacterium]
MRNRVQLGLIVSALLLLVGPVAADSDDQKSYSPAVGPDFPTNVYFGDTHLHTNTSLDAYGDGNSKVGPDEVHSYATRD